MKALFLLGLPVLFVLGGCMDSDTLGRANSGWHQTGTVGTPSQVAAEQDAADPTQNNINNAGTFDQDGPVDNSGAVNDK